MGSPADLTLGCRAPAPLHTNVYSNGSASADNLERFRKLEEYLKALEDERRKIEAFKRELPYCMQLLDYAIEASKEHLGDSQPSATSSRHQLESVCEKEVSRSEAHGKRLLEEFLKERWDKLKKEDEELPVKGKGSSTVVKADKPTWMAEAQLWRQPTTSDPRKEKDVAADDGSNRQRNVSEPSGGTNPALLFNKQRQGGAFLPYIIKDKPAPPATATARSRIGGADLGLSSGESRQVVCGISAVESEVGSIDAIAKDVGIEMCQGKDVVGRGGGNISGAGSTSSGGGQGQRKARRCWSPELHRRFVNALQQLGGSQIATPKQIRELMKVDGLTNDEVKSHLQKYRLHTRRPSPAPQVSQQSAPQLVVLGGIWVPPEYANAGHYCDPAASVCQQPAHFCQPSMSQEFYSPSNPASGVQAHPSQSQNSPQGPLQSASQISGLARQTSGDRYREDSGGEEGKSESSSWKGENESQGRSSKDELADREGMHREEGDDDSDYDDEREDQMSLQLDLSCLRGRHIVKAEPQMV